MLNELLSEPALKGIAPVQVNFDTDAEFKKTWNTPTRSVIVVFRNGKEVGRALGVTNKDSLRQLLAGVAPSS